MKLYSTLLNISWIKEQVSREIIKYFEPNENENYAYKNWQESDKSMLRDKFIALNVYYNITDSLCYTAETNTTL